MTSRMYEKPLPMLPFPMGAFRVEDRNVQPPPPLYRVSIHDKPIDLPQRIEHKLARYNASQNVFNRWLFEVVSVTTSAICMGETARVRSGPSS